MGIVVFVKRLLGLRPAKDTEARRLKSEIRKGVEVCKEKAAQGDSEASLRLNAFKENVTEQSIRLKGKALTIAIVLLALAAGGCSMDKEFVDRMDAPAKQLLPDLRKVYKGESLTLSEDQRARRLVLLDEWEKTIREAKKSTEK